MTFVGDPLTIPDHREYLVGRVTRLVDASSQEKSVETPDDVTFRGRARVPARPTPRMGRVPRRRVPAPYKGRRRQAAFFRRPVEKVPCKAALRPLLDHVAVETKVAPPERRLHGVPSATETLKTALRPDQPCLRPRKVVYLEDRPRLRDDGSPVRPAMPRPETGTRPAYTTVVVLASDVRPVLPVVTLVPDGRDRVVATSAPVRHPRPPIAIEPPPRRPSLGRPCVRLRPSFRVYSDLHLHWFAKLPKWEVRRKCRPL